MDDLSAWLPFLLFWVAPFAVAAALLTARDYLRRRRKARRQD